MCLIVLSVDILHMLELVINNFYSSSRKLDSTLFVAESFEDLSTDLALKKFDGEYLADPEKTESVANDTDYGDNGKLFIIQICFYFPGLA